MPFQIAPNPRTNGSFNIAANQRGRFSSVLSLGWDAVTGKPDLPSLYQPLDADLTAIASLTTQSFGRSLLTQASAAAARSTLGGLREVLSANRTYYVRTDGNDSNTGTANTAGGAFLTLQKAMDVTASLDCSIYNVTINVGAGTYAPLILKTYIGSGIVAFVGDITTPSNVVISFAGVTVSTTAMTGNFTMSGFRVQASSSQDIRVGTPCTLTLDHMEYAGSSGAYHIYANSGGKIVLTGSSHTIFSTGGNGQFLSEQFGNILLASATITWGANVTYGAANITAQKIGYIDATSTTFTVGAFTVTGTRYSANSNGVIFTNGGGASFIPGTVSGSTATGGQYV